MRNTESYQNAFKLLINIIKEKKTIQKIPKELEDDKEFRELYNSLLELKQAFMVKDCYINELKNSLLKKHHLSYHDQLTGLYNRRFYDEEIENIDIQTNLPITLVLADVNGLKLTNDVFGHAVGDDLLKKFSKILNNSLREGDFAARIGGDEFAIILPRTSSIKAKKIVNIIKSNIDKEAMDRVILSVSFGFDTKKDICESFDNLYKQAENQMYHNKLLESRSMKNEMIKIIYTNFYENNVNEKNHCERISKHCMDIGIKLGLSLDSVEELGLLGLLHDIGKVGIKERVLKKTDKLTDSELNELRRHPEVGYQILTSSNELACLADYVLAHHERIDGKGYPRQLKGVEIPLQAKILSIAEAYDTMTHHHPYQPRLSVKEAILELKKNSNTQFDADIVNIFVNNIL